MADKHEHGDDESLRVTLDFELADPTGTGSGGLLFLDGGDDFTEFGLNSAVVSRHVSDPGEVLESLGVSVLGSQPTGRLLDEGNDGEHDGKRGELHGDRDLPDSGCTLEGCADAGEVVDPVGEGDTDDDADLEETSDISSHVGGGQFGNIGGADRRLDTDTDTGEESTGILVVEVHTGGLQDTLKDAGQNNPRTTNRATHSDHEDDATNQQTLLSTDGVVHGSSTQSTEERTYGGESASASGCKSALLLTTLKNRDDVGLDVSDVVGVTVNLHVIQERLLGNDTTTETGIVTEKDDTKVGGDSEHD